MSKYFHFTKTLDNLMSILNGRYFKVAYCRETFTVNGKRISGAAHPMVSFSAYDFTEMPNREISYGRYAIVMRNQWIEKNNINPVLYVAESSQVAQALGLLLQSRQGKKNFQLPNTLRLPIIQLKCFTKNTIGHNSFFEQDDFAFHEENEWRYVPTLKQLNGSRLSQNLSTYNRYKQFHINKIADQKLSFTLMDVEKIFVATNEDLKLIKSITALDSIPCEISNWLDKNITKT
jgi:hypothetical protein